MEFCQGHLTDRPSTAKFFYVPRENVQIVDSKYFRVGPATQWSIFGNYPSPHEAKWRLQFFCLPKQDVLFVTVDLEYLMRLLLL